MKLSEHWLREWINPPLTTQKLAEKLTMSGLEIEAITPVAGKFSKVIVGQILRIEKHPQADRLHVCLVDVGSRVQLTIVCAATNVREQMKAPVAMESAALPNGLQIKKTDIRGVSSHGMLCSTKDLGLSEESQGLYELPVDAPLGREVWDYLNLSDNVIDVSITPNRGDCLSMLGLAKDISAVTRAPLHFSPIAPVRQKISDQLKIELQLPEECPCYVGRIIRDVKADAVTPVWMQERLRRSGVRCISPIVDIMNYVMFELGQPMHAFDLEKIDKGIFVRKAKKNEELLLLDGNTVKLDPEAMVIADHRKPLAIAGVMGGMDSGVTLLTKDIFLESAYFNPHSILKMNRRYAINSESSYRFERGIDPSMQEQAIERATQLILEIAGGKPGPVVKQVQKKYLPKDIAITLRHARVDQLLGISLSKSDIEGCLKQLGFKLKKIKQGWKVTVPARRSDVQIEVDLIEEIIRLYGYDKIPLKHSAFKLNCLPQPEHQLNLANLRYALRDLGYQEVITYSFIDSKIQNLFDPGQQPKALLNPITSDMSVMRTSLWPGLIHALLYNQNRQQPRARLFETGLRFIPDKKNLKQEPVMAGLINGAVFPEQWGIPNRAADFFDLKGDLSSLFRLNHALEEFSFEPGVHPALHPGQTALIRRKGQPVGYMGLLHPTLTRELEVVGSTYAFELTLDSLLKANIPKAKGISKFPEIRRDLSILVDKTISSMAIQDTIINVAGEFLKEITVFDVYEGKGIDSQRKSLGLALTLQHSSRTLVDDEVGALMESILTTLKNKFAVDLRG